MIIPKVLYPATVSVLPGSSVPSLKRLTTLTTKTLCETVQCSSIIDTVSGIPYFSGIETKYVDLWMPSGKETRRVLRLDWYPAHSLLTRMQVSSALKVR